MLSLATGLLAAGITSHGATAEPAALLGSTIANTGYITAPDLVSTGMTNILAFVPEQEGATYRWSVTGGTIPGVTANASVFFNAGAVGRMTVQCVVSLSGVQTTYSQSIPVRPVLPVATSWYGSGLGADDLANTVVGGPSLNTVSFRFLAKHAGVLKSIRVFFIWSLVKTGYQAGQGGTIKVDLEADDGTGAHLPTGDSLASVSYGNILAQNHNYPELTFPVPAALKGGGIYHLVFTNVDPDPTVNYISLDALYSDAQTAPIQPSSTDTAFAELVRSESGPWKLRPGFTPTLELDYADGASQGNGYIEVWSTNPKRISANAMVRQAFTVSGPARSFTKVMVRLNRVAGTSPLTVQVAEADGTVIETGTIAASEVLEGVSAWVTCTFPLSHVLATGIGYTLTLTSPADTPYSIYPIRKGHDKGFSNCTIFPDGCAQYTTTGSTGWAGWDMWGNPDQTDSDLQFMFVP
jgi:hypothetical protein